MNNIKIYAGSNFSCIIDANNSLYTWGYNYTGMTGLAFSNNPVITPYNVKINNYSLPKNDWLSICLFKYNTIYALDKNSNIFMWAFSRTYTGNSQPNYLVDPVLDLLVEIRTYPNLLSPVQISGTDGFIFIINTLGKLYYHDIIYDTQNLPKTPIEIPQIGNSKWIKTECGEAHSVFINANGDLYGLAFYSTDNDYSQLGINKVGNLYKIQQINNKKWIDIACGIGHTLALNEDGNLYGLGINNNGELGININLCKNKNPGFYSRYSIIYYIDTPILIKSNISKIKCGYSHSFAIDNNNELYVWGKNTNGQLGINSVTNAFEPKLLDKILNQKWIDVAGGQNHSLFLTENNEIYSCGNNEYSQLGNKTKSNTNTLIPTIIYSNNRFSNVSLITLPSSSTTTTTSRSPTTTSRSPTTTSRSPTTTSRSPTTTSRSPITTTTSLPEKLNSRFPTTTSISPSSSIVEKKTEETDDILPFIVFFIILFIIILIII